MTDFRKPRIPQTWESCPWVLEVLGARTGKQACFVVSEQLASQGKQNLEGTSCPQPPRVKCLKEGENAAWEISASGAPRLTPFYIISVNKMYF